MCRKVLIIKTGCAEVFTEDSPSQVISLGDVFRTTFSLHYFEKDCVDWLTSEKAVPLLKNKYIQNVLTDEDALEINKYDLIINLEKNKNNELSNNKKVVGFFYKNNNLMVRKNSGDEYLFKNYLELIKHESETFQYKLADILGKKWKGEKYILEAKICSNNLKNIGLNWASGTKWPSKEINISFWKEIEKKLEIKNKVSWQSGFDNLQQYIEWINSCDTIITLDSLGLHLSLALNKNVIALFGPTNESNVELYGLGKTFNYKDGEYNSIIPGICNEID